MNESDPHQLPVSSASQANASANPNVPVPLALSTPQRDAAIERLTKSFAEDAITMDEFERRAELVYSAVTMSDLQKLVADLPAPPEPVSAKTGKSKVARGVVVGDRINTVLGSTERRMPAVVPRQLNVRTILGNTELDFRHSTFEPGITEVHVRCILGNVEITVPGGVRVELLCGNVLANVGTTGSGGYELQPVGGEAAPERVLRVTGRAVLANVEVHRGQPPDEDH